LGRALRVGQAYYDLSKNQCRDGATSPTHEKGLVLGSVSLRLIGLLKLLDGALYYPKLINFTTKKITQGIVTLQVSNVIKNEKINFYFIKKLGN
jgi:hypothetical protein